MPQRNLFLHIIRAKDAKSNGLKKYFTGKECKNGNIFERVLPSGLCMCGDCINIRNSRRRELANENRDEIRARANSYYHENKEKINEQSRLNRQRNKEYVLEYEKQYREKNKEKLKTKRRIYDARYKEKNPEKVKQANKKWYENNKDKVSKNRLKRIAVKNLSVPSWYGEFDDFVMAEAQDKSAFLEKETGIKWHVDHMIPMQSKIACGLHCGLNFQVIPATLNYSKGNRLKYTKIGEWLKDI